jgi:hypothetical protein
MGNITKTYNIKLRKDQEYQAIPTQGISFSPASRLIQPMGAFKSIVSFGG